MATHFGDVWNRHSRAALRALLTFGLPILFIYLILRTTDLRDTLRMLSDANLPLVVAGLVTSFVCILAWNRLWQFLLKIYGIEYGLGRLLQILFAGLFAGFFIPGDVGSFVSVLYLRADGHPVRQSLLTVLLKNSAQVAVTIGFGLSALFVFPGLVHVDSALWAVAVLAALAVTCAIVYWRRLDIAPRLKQLVESRLHRIAYQFAIAEVGGIYRDLRLLTVFQVVGILVVSVLVRAIELFGLYLFALSLHIQLSFWTITACMSIMILVTMLPVSISGIGTREASLVFLFSALGERPELAVALSMLVLLNVVVWRALGMFAWIKSPPRWRVQGPAVGS